MPLEVQVRLESLKLLWWLDNSRIVLGVSARQADRRGAGAAAILDVDQSALHVELSAHGVVSIVKGDDLGTHEVVSGWNARGHGEAVHVVSHDGPRDLPRLAYLHHPPLAIMVSTPHFPVLVFKPSSATLNHFKPVGETEAAAAFGTAAR